jgi:hypothetical protein
VLKLKKAKIVLALAVAFGLALPGLGHAYTWYSYGGHNYALTTGVLSWDAVEAEAVAQGGHLATVNDAAEQSWLFTTFGQHPYWIGFTDQAVEGTWVWTSGDPVTYTNWDLNEPDNSNDEDYAVMNWHSTDSGWNDWREGNHLTGIIEVASQVVPLPPSAWLLGSSLLALVGWRRFRKG